MDALPPGWNTPEVQCLQAHARRELGGLVVGDLVLTIDGRRGQVAGFGCATPGDYLVHVAVGADRYPYWRRLADVAKARP